MSRNHEGLGFTVLLTAGALWMLGGNYVRHRCLKRMGRPKPLRFDGPGPFRLRELNAAERRLLLLIGIVAIALGFVGTGLLNGVYD